MGFGYLFIGYFFMLFFPIDGIGVLPNLAAVGLAVMFVGLRKLSGYASDCKGFRYALYTIIPYFAVAVAMLGINIAEMSGELSPALNTYFVKPLSLAADILYGVYTVFLMVGIYKLARQVELPKLASRSAVVMSLTVMFTLCQTISNIASFVTAQAPETVTVAVNFIGFAAFLLEYAAIFMGLAHIFTCYMHICLEGDEDMPYREDIFDKIIAFTKRNKK